MEHTVLKEEYKVNPYRVQAIIEKPSLINVIDIRNS